MMLLSLLLACTPEPTANAPGAPPPGGQPPAGDPGQPAPPSGEATPPAGDMGAGTLAPGKLADLSPGDTAGKLKLTFTGASDVTVDFATTAEGGAIRVLAQEKVAGTSAELAVPAKREGEVWVTAWKDEKGDGPDPSDPIGFASKPISFNVPENTLTIVLSVGAAPPAGSPFKPGSGDAGPPPPAPAPAADGSVPPAAAPAAGSPPPAQPPG